MKASLSIADINNTIKNVQALKEDIEDTRKNIVTILIEKGEAMARSYNDSAAPSGVEESVVISRIVKAKNEGQGASGYIALTGPNAVYDEFGTGEEGASNPHPLKQNFPLNPYNSGYYVSTHINPANGRHYWIIPEDHYIPSQYVEEGGYTEGIPAGKQMYKTSEYLRSIKDGIIKKEFSDAIRRNK